MVVFVGEPIVVPENIQVTIDCGQLIDQAIMMGGVANITWRKNGRIIVNDSEVNVVLSPDNRTIIITDTFLGTPAQVGTDGLYSCEVCESIGGTCMINITDPGPCCKCITR